MAIQLLKTQDGESVIARLVVETDDRGNATRVFEMPGPDEKTALARLSDVIRRVSLPSDEFSRLGAELDAEAKRLGESDDDDARNDNLEKAFAASAPATKIEGTATGVDQIESKTKRGRPAKDSSD